MSDKPQGCTNGHCWLRIKPLIGQHTNGGCNCLRDVPVTLRLAIERKIQSQRKRIERLRAENVRFTKLLAERVAMDAGKIDGVDLGLMVASEELVEELRKAGEMEDER